MWKAGRQVPMITSFIFSSHLMVSYLDIAAVMCLFLALVMAVPNADIVEWEVEDLELLVGAKSLSIAKRDSLTYRSCCELAQNGDSKQALSKFSVFFQADADIWLGMLRVGA